MKKLENSFAVSGYIAKDAEKKTFKSATVARVLISVSRPEKVNDQTVYRSALQQVEIWKKNENAAELDILKKGTLITLEGYFKPEEWEDNGNKKSRIIFTATKFYPAPEK